MPKPLCFMVMPFGTKPVVPAVQGAPARIDFDKLWHEALDPTLRALGYETFRADQDTGSMIIHEMLARLYFSDLVVADMTIPNGNVYYEIGIRHAARDVGCVLIAADWSQPLFDTQQMRRITYPLADEAVLKLYDALDTYVPLPERPIDQPFLMPIEDVFSISGRGTVVTGRIERGKIKVGEEVEIVGLRDTQKSVVTGV